MKTFKLLALIQKIGLELIGSTTTFEFYFYDDGKTAVVWSCWDVDEIRFSSEDEFETKMIGELKRMYVRQFELDEEFNRSDAEKEFDEYLAETRKEMG